jgi:hypothetical protein
VQSEAAATTDTAKAVEAEQDGLSGMSRAELKAWIAENNLTAAIKVTLKHTDEDVRNMIREYIANQPAEETAEQPADEAVDTAADEAAAAQLNDLLVFCSSQGITEVTEGMSLEEITAVMLTYQYKRDEITDDELELLTTVGIPEANIITSAPVPAAPKVSAPKVGMPKAPVAKPAAPAKPVAPAAKPGLPKPGAPKAGVRPGLPGKK